MLIPDCRNHHLLQCLVAETVKALLIHFAELLQERMATHHWTIDSLSQFASKAFRHLRQEVNVLFVHSQPVHLSMTADPIIDCFADFRRHLILGKIGPQRRLKLVLLTIKITKLCHAGCDVGDER